MKKTNERIEKVWQGIAKSEKTPPAILEKLAKRFFGEEENVVICLLSQQIPNANQSVLETLESYIQNHYYPGRIVKNLKAGSGKYLLKDWQKLLDEMGEADSQHIRNLGNKETDLPKQLLDRCPEANSLYQIVKHLATRLKIINQKVSIGISLVGNPNTPKTVREKLLKQLASLPKEEKNYEGYIAEKDLSLYLSIAFNSAIPLEERNEYFQQIIVSRNSRILAINPQTPPEILAKLPIDSVRDELAINPHTPPNILRQLAQTKSSYTRSRVAENPSTPTDVLVELAKEKDLDLSMRGFYTYQYRNYEDWKKFLCDYPRMPKLELYRILLAKEIEEETAETEDIIYRCIHIPAIQSYLMERGDRSARLRIAIHRNAPLHLLEQLIADPEPKVRAEVAENKRTPPHLLEQLITDPEPKVRAEVAENQNLPWHLLLQLTKDEDINVRKKLIGYTRYKHEQTPVEILEALTNDEAEEIRVLVASQSYTPAYILNQLANDTSLKVKEKVVSNLNTPVEVLDRLWRENGLFDIRNPNTPGHVLAEAISKTRSSDNLYKLLDNSVKGSQIPASTLEKLASHKDSLVRYHAAEHPNTASNVLVKLADDEYEVTRWCVASNPNTPPHILEQLLSKWEYCVSRYPQQTNTLEYDRELCRRLAQRRDAPAIVLEYLAESENEDVRQAVADNPSTPVSGLVKLALTECEEWVLRTLSKNPSLDAEVAEKFAQRPEPEVRLYAIDSPHITPEIWQKLARDESAEVREAIALNSNSVTTIVLTTTFRDIPTTNTSKYRHLSPELQKELLQDSLNGHTISTTVIQHPHLPLELWQELATDSEVKVRQAAAINPDAPVSILELLAVDENSEVRQKLAHNSHLPVSILERLGMDISAAVRAVVAKSERIPIELLEQLALDEKPEIMQALIDNPNTPASVRQSLRYRLRTNISPTLRGLSRLYDPETDDLATILSEYVTSSVPFVRLISLMHPLTPIPCLEVGAKSTFWWERYAVAVNPATPVELRQKLAEDSHDIVKAVAKT